MTDGAQRPDTTEATALRLDRDDPVPTLRDSFELPLAPNGDPAIYVCGHSLGPLAKSARALLERETDDWGRLGVEGHFKQDGPWFSYTDLLSQSTGRLAGASPAEVVTMNSLTVNLHQMFASFYRPTPERFKIIIEDGAFPSDRYAVASQLRHHGFDPAEAMVLAKPRDGEELLRSEDIEALIEHEREQLALLWLPGVQYVTGQVLNVERLTVAGHTAGAMVGWDMAHMAGNVPMRLHDWNVDFAVWCTYKYINAGPGATGQAFVHERWADDPDVVRLAGWWGNDAATRFTVPFEFVPHGGASSWQASNPPVLALAPLRASLALFDEVGIEPLRERSIRMTGYLAGLIEGLDGVGIITPADPAQRGAMLNLRVPERSSEVQRMLGERGVILDFREPDIFRLALAPMYNTYQEGWRVVQILREIITELGS
jgi:kynureninase